jgi:lipid II:glycine glycyltransferase (peptidoglycan interpeptide bridge formation enzyme)
MSAFGSFAEFWVAMGRLYDQQLNHDEQIAENATQISRLREAQEQTNEQMKQTDARLDRLASTVTTLAGTVAKMSLDIESHERPLERMEGQ